MTIYAWLSDNWIEITGAVAGIIYVFLEIRQSLWLWPLGIITSVMYIFVFFTGKLYADMFLQVYYLSVSCIGWYWWIRGAGRRTKSLRHEGGQAGANGKDDYEHGRLSVTRLEKGTLFMLLIIFSVIFALLWSVLSRYTDSPVPGWDSFLTSLSVIATWMLARKIFEHWFLWILANAVYVTLFISRGLMPTALLYGVYFIMSFAGLSAWKKTLYKNHVTEGDIK